MQPSRFNVQVPLADRNEVFLMNTFSDAQLLVTPDVASLLDRVALPHQTFSAGERDTIESLVENGFVVASRDEEHKAVGEYFDRGRNDTEQLRVTILTTLQCNFACDYCMQGDHGDHNLFAHKMSLDTAGRVADWIETQLDEVRPEKFVLSFFGGEPLLNIPVIYLIAERTFAACQARGIPQLVNVITNGLLLTNEFVDRMLPFGLNGVKITLDGDKDTHNRMRPLRGRQGTFDRIVENMRRVAGKVAITLGGNFDESSVESFPALLDFLKEQDFADSIGKINFKPIIKFTMAQPAPVKGLIPLTVVGGSGKPLNGACMTGAGAGTNVGAGTASSMCDSCNFVDEKMEFLRSETRKRGFPTPDGVHMGPCEIHRRHAHTIGIDGSLYACPGFGSETSESIGHVAEPGSGRMDALRAEAIARFERLSPLKEECGDCSFVPVCGGGCSVAAHAEAGDVHAPSCHKGAFESALVSLAQRTAASVTYNTQSAN